MATHYIAPDMTPVTPYLYIEDAARAIDFYTKVMGAKERMRMPGPDGTVMHAELMINGGLVMMGEANPGMDMKSPKALGGASGGLFVYVPDVDATVKAARAAGAKPVGEIENMFWGDRTGRIVDPWGHHWTLATHVEDVAPGEMERRIKDWTAKSAGES